MNPWLKFDRTKLCNLLLSALAAVIFVYSSQQLICEDLIHLFSLINIVSNNQLRHNWSVIQFLIRCRVLFYYESTSQFHMTVFPYSNLTLIQLSLSLCNVSYNAYWIVMLVIHVYTLHFVIVCQNSNYQCSRCFREALD